MPRNGSGTYTRTDGTYTGSTVWGQNASVGNKISSTRFDTHDQDIADALSQSISKDGQTTPTAHLPMGGFKHTGCASGTARDDYGLVGQIQDSDFIYGGTSSGAANVYAITLTPAITAYDTGQRFVFKSHQTNTSNSVTLAVNGLTATVIRKGAGATSILAGDILSGMMVDVTYDAGTSSFHLLNPVNRLTANAGISAAGTTQGTATALSAQINNVTSCTAGVSDGVILPAAYSGDVRYIFNSTAATCKVYPATGGVIDALGTNNAFSLTTGTKKQFICYTDGSWFSM